MPTLGEQIKELRVKNGMTQEELAQKLNTTKAAISRYEKNQRKPKFEVLTSIAMILNANPDELFNLYFQFENIEGERSYNGEQYFKALSNWIQTLMPDAYEQTNAQCMDEWLIDFNSPFAFYHTDDMSVIKKLIETILDLDRIWQRELLADAQKYLEFQEQKKDKFNKMQQDVK